MKALLAKDVWSALHKGGSARMPEQHPPGFEIDEQVKARTMNHDGHIRLPEYIQGKPGVIAADHGTFIFPDRHANGIKQAMRLYSVRFEAVDVWGEASGQWRDAIYVDLFESYLEPV